MLSFTMNNTRLPAFGWRLVVLIRIVQTVHLQFDHVNVDGKVIVDNIFEELVDREFSDCSQHGDGHLVTWGKASQIQI